MDAGRTPQAKEWKESNGKGRWPRKSVNLVQNLLKNAEANAEFKGLSVDELSIGHIQVNRAQKLRRRTYRAHGRVGAYMSSPCHVEMIIAEDEDDVEKSDEASKTVRFTRKQLARHRLIQGGGVAGSK